MLGSSGSWRLDEKAGEDMLPACLSCLAERGLDDDANRDSLVATGEGSHGGESVDRDVGGGMRRRARSVRAGTNLRRQETKRKEDGRVFPPLPVGV